MSWASSNAPLVVRGFQCGWYGSSRRGPLRAHDFKEIIGQIKNETKKPWGVNIPLNNPRAPELLDIAHAARIPVMVASQGGPRGELARFRAIGTKWLHVVASAEHAKKAEAAGVDVLVVDGAEAGGHPPASEVGTIVLVRRVIKATKLAGGGERGIADGAGIAALLALGADAVQLGTRFIATHEASVHENYKRAVLAADVDATALVGPAALPIRQAEERVFQEIPGGNKIGREQRGARVPLRGRQPEAGRARGRRGMGKVEAGQSAGLVDEILPAAEVMRRLVASSRPRGRGSARYD